MSFLYRPYPKASARSRDYPWPIFLFLTLAMFLVLHWPPEVQRTLGDYNMAQEDIVAQSSGSVIRQGTLLVLAALSVASLLTYPANRPLRYGTRLGWFVAAFASWAVMSTVWAEDPFLVLKRLVTFATFGLVAVAVVRRFSFLEVLLWTFVTTALF